MPSSSAEPRPDRANPAAERAAHDEAPHRIDVFVSLSGTDRDEVRKLVAALRAAGLDVFVDEDNIRYFHGITAKITDALWSAKTLLAYYSEEFARRPACQYELTAAFLAGQREGDPARRVMVINPEPTVGHLQPVELSDARFTRLPAPADRASMARTVDRIVAHVRGVRGGMGAVPPGEQPRWYTDRVPGAHGFVGRYREQWALHTALSGDHFGLTRQALTGPVALVTGLPGAGRTGVVEAYAWRFGAAHRGGVYWTSLAGAGTSPAEVRARFAAGLASIAARKALPLAGAGPDQVPALFAEFLAGQPEPSLVVVDDVPPNLAADALAGLVLPGGARVRTVLITTQAPHRGPVPTVEIGPMAEADAVALLREYRRPDGPDEAEALERIADLLDGHAHALTLAGDRLRGRDGVMSCAAYADRLAAEPGLISPVSAVFRAALDRLTPIQLLMLQVFVVCGRGELPAAFVGRVVAALEPDRADPDRIASALVDLGDRRLASRTGTSWRLAGLVHDAARQYRPVVSPPQVARALASEIRACTDPGQLDQLMRAAAALATRTDLPDSTIEALLRQAVRYHEPRGEAAAAAPLRRLLAARHPDDPAESAASARTQYAAGEYDAAIADAARALRLMGDAALMVDCVRVTAESLDALGRLDEAERYWQELLPHRHAGPGSAGVAVPVRVAVIRSMRRRGQYAQAEREAKELLAAYPSAGQPGPDDRTDPDAPNGPGDPIARAELLDQLADARLELATVQLATDDQLIARDTAATVLRQYQDRGLPNHALALAAQQVFAEAQLALPLRELRPDPARWRRAERTLRDLHERLRRGYGRVSPVTLTAAVAHAQALVALGRPEPAEQALTTLLPDIEQRCRRRHPLYLRASFLLGQAYAQQRRHDLARRHLLVAFEGQRDTLGPTHAHTLASQFELGVAMKLTGDDRAARRMFTAVSRAAPHSIGRCTDLYLQSMFARVLTNLPRQFWTWATPAPDNTRGEP